MEEDDQVPIQLRIRGRMEDMQPAMRRVGEIIESDPSRVVSMPITALAQEARTSETTVIRFCRVLGLAGYSELRLRLAAELGAQGQQSSTPVDTGDIVPGDDIKSVVEKIAYADTSSVADTAKALSLRELSAVVADVVAAERILIFGVGASGLVAADFQQKLHRIGLTAFSFADAHLAASSAGLANEKTVAFGFSHSGRTRDTLTPLRLARENGATAVAVTNSPDSPITQVADRTLLTVARETTFRAGATGSRLAQLTVIDCLFVAIAQQTFDQSLQALEATRASVSELVAQQARS